MWEDEHTDAERFLAVLVEAKATIKLTSTGQLMKIEVRDHIILGDKAVHPTGWCSLREMGYFYN